MRIFIVVLFQFLVVSNYGQINIVIKSLPNTTPVGDTIFITGTFNNWAVNNEHYMLHPQLNGMYSISLPIDTGKIEFKFTRGSWLKVETNEINQYIQNRVVNCLKNTTYFVEIENWQDLGGLRQFNYLLLLLFAIAFYGVIMMYFSLRIQYRIRIFNKPFFAFNSALIISLIGAVVHNQSNLIWQSHIATLGMILFFAWGPLMHLFLNKVENANYSPKILIHSIPAILVLIIAILRFVNFKLLSFYTIELNAKLNWGSGTLILAGIIINLSYHILNYKSFKIRIINYRSVHQKISFIALVYLISFGSLLLFISFFLLMLFGWDLVIFNSYEPVLLLLSSILFVEFFYYWKNPELFQNHRFYKSDEHILKENHEKNNYFLPSKKIFEKIPTVNLPVELIEELKKKIYFQMEEKKVFTDPKLSIAGLSEIIDTKAHILSKLLNEEFHKSFRDFINEYRIQEFIKLASSEKYKNYTLLALSYEVGFNSKSTFNLAFKKVAGLSPREYLKNSEISLNE